MWPTYQAPASWIRKCPEFARFRNREIIAIKVRQSELSRNSAGLTTGWHRKPLKNPLSRLERPERMRPAASRQIYLTQNFTCTSLTCQCVYVKIFRLENPKRKARSGRIQTGTSFPSLALIPFAWAPRSVSFLCFQLGFSFGLCLCLIFNDFLTFYVRVACRLCRFWSPSSSSFTLKNQGEKKIFDCFVLSFFWSSAQWGLRIV